MKFNKFTFVVEGLIIYNCKMSKLQSLVLLTHSMSLAEKKAFRIRSLRYKAKSDYMILYDIIEQNREQPAPVVLPEFLKERPRASFETTIKYLYDLLLDSMLDLRKEQDSFYFLWFCCITM